MAESKVKAHSRRTKAGQVRVKEGRRKKSLGQKVAIAGATGVSLVGLGLAGKKLGKTIQTRKAIKEFSPKADTILNNKGRSAYTNNSSTNQLNNAKNTLYKTKLNNTQVVSSNLPDPSKIKSTRKVGNNSAKVLARRKLLQQVESTVEGDMKPIYLASSSVNKNKSSRKQAGKRLSDAAKDLRSRGFYQ